MVDVLGWCLLLRLEWVLPLFAGLTAFKLALGIDRGLSAALVALTAGPIFSGVMFWGQQYELSIAQRLVALAAPSTASLFVYVLYYPAHLVLLLLLALHLTGVARGHPIISNVLSLCIAAAVQPLSAFWLMLATRS